MIFIVINPNIIENTKFYYYDLDIAINYLLIFFGLAIKININCFFKKWVYDFDPNILFKYINSKSAMSFVK